MAEVAILAKDGWTFCNQPTSMIFPRRYRCNWIGPREKYHDHEYECHRNMHDPWNMALNNGVLIAVFPTIVHFKEAEEVRKPWRHKDYVRVRELMDEGASQAEAASQAKFERFTAKRISQYG